MLWAAKRQGVDAHPPGAVEFAAAGIIAGTLQLEQSGSQVAESIATDDHGAACRFPDRAVEGQSDFRRRSAAVGEMPAGVSHIRTHGGAPSAQQVEAGVVVLDQLETPRSHA